MPDSRKRRRRCRREFRQLVPAKPGRIRAGRSENRPQNEQNGPNYGNYQAHRRWGMKSIFRRRSATHRTKHAPRSLDDVTEWGSMAMRRILLRSLVQSPGIHKAGRPSGSAKPRASLVPPARNSSMRKTYAGCARILGPHHNGQVTATFSRDGWRFSPSHHVLNGPDTAADCVAEYMVFCAGGRVLSLNGVGASGVSVRLSSVP